jgi:hypothetical protein
MTARDLKEPPYEVSQQSEKRKHEHPAYPDQEVPRHLGVVNLFLVHALKLARREPEDIGLTR